MTAQFNMIKVPESWDQRARGAGHSGVVVLQQVIYFSCYICCFSACFPPRLFPGVDRGISYPNFLYHHRDISQMNASFTLHCANAADSPPPLA